MVMKKSHPTEEPLFQCAARRAFCTLTKTPLAQLAKAVGCSLDPNDSMFAVVRKLVDFAFEDYLPKLTQTELVDIMLLRMQPSDIYSAF
eukprot:9280754-Heterocapsa_arctica.AAC.1